MTMTSLISVLLINFVNNEFVSANTEH